MHQVRGGGGVGGASKIHQGQILANATNLRRTPPRSMAVHAVHSKAAVLLFMLHPLNVVFVFRLVIVLGL